MKDFTRIWLRILSDAKSHIYSHLLTYNIRNSVTCNLLHPILFRFRINPFFHSILRQYDRHTVTYVFHFSGRGTREKDEAREVIFHTVDSGEQGCVGSGGLDEVCVSSG